MPKGVGKALEKAIITKEDKLPSERGEGEGKFVFMNKNRREIFQYLCLHPCSQIAMISKAADMSIHAASWHLRRLVENDYIHKSSSGKKTVFFPVEFVHIDDIPLFTVLNTLKAKTIYLVISDNDGISQGNICKMLDLNHQAVIWYTKKLEDLGLITSLEDGKYRRYYQTDLLFRKQEENNSRMKKFKNRAMKKFRGERLSPTILRSTDQKLVVRLAKGKSRTVLTLHTNPFVTVLS